MSGQNTTLNAVIPRGMCTLFRLILLFCMCWSLILHCIWIKNVPLYFSFITLPNAYFFLKFFYWQN